MSSTRTDGYSTFVTNFMFCSKFSYNSDSCKSTVLLSTPLEHLFYQVNSITFNSLCLPYTHLSDGSHNKRDPSQLPQPIIQFSLGICSPYSSYFFDYFCLPPTIILNLFLIAFFHFRLYHCSISDFKITQKRGRYTPDRRQGFCFTHAELRFSNIHSQIDL